jgi:hypothetical protein
VKTGPDGTYEIPNVPVNSHVRFEVADPRFATMAGTAYQVANSQLADIDPIKLVPGFALGGTVRMEGHGVSGVAVDARSLPDTRKGSVPSVALGHAVTDAEGHYRIAKLPGGSYAVVTSPSDAMLQKVDAGSVQDTPRLDGSKPVAPVDFDLLPGSTIEGQVFHADGSAAATQISVCEDVSGRDAFYSHMVATAKDGTFRIHVPPGQHLVSLQDWPFSPDEHKVETKEGQSYRLTFRVP